MAYVNCGHIPPLLLRECGTVKRLDATATVVGLVRKLGLLRHEIQMQPGDELSIVSDGVTEATASNGDEFGESRLLSVLRQTRKLELDKILQRIGQAVEEFRSGAYWQDDLTMVVARAQ